MRSSTKYQLLLRPTKANFVLVATDKKIPHKWWYVLVCLVTSLVCQQKKGNPLQTNMTLSNHVKSTFSINIFKLQMVDFPASHVSSQFQVSFAKGLITHNGLIMTLCIGNRLFHSTTAIAHSTDDVVHAPIPGGETHVGLTADCNGLNSHPC